jgi:4'-phosphopantetheinyl transferase
MRALPLPRDEIHVWHCELADREDEHRQHCGFLAPDEEAHCRRLRFEIDRVRYRQARCARRVILAAYVGCRPDEIQFACTSSGKPFVHEMSLPGPLTFSASRSEDVALLAIARGREIGVDIEKIREPRVWMPIACTLLAASESSALFRLPEPLASEAFASIWVRKESLLKALGWGLGLGLHAVPAVLVPSPARQSHVELVAANAQSWCVHELASDPGYAAAVACEGGVRNVRLFCYRGADAFGT